MVALSEPAAETRGRPAAGTIPALEVAGVSHSFGRTKALDDVSFTIMPGSFTVLLGPNGAGKTTLFSLVTRLYNTRTGSIRVYGYEVARQPSKALARIGAVFQQRSLEMDLSVAQNLHYHAALHGIARDEAARRIATELARQGLADRIGSRIRQLSGGQIRRVELAQAMLHRPRLLLLDEPTVGLDIGSRQALLDHVRHLCRSDGIGVLWATHLIDEIGPEDQVVVLHRGRVLAQGDVAAVTRQAGAADIRDAFAKLTGTGKPGGTSGGHSP
ncbi:MAG: ATP-binding cassette domain-containing protein [Rhodospirillaceae bacterium]|nr:ATP-binding cassette domain-containing protein [Rhodospirillaceae bacterium]